MAPQIGMVLGDHDQVALADVDGPVATWAEVPLACRVRLHGDHHLVVERHHPPHDAHTTMATAMARVTPTITRSRGDRRPVRKGLKPIGAWYGGYRARHVRGA